MVAHKFQRKVGRPQLIVLLPLLLCVAVAAGLSTGCSSHPTDLRTLVPADALVYLETNDLAEAMKPIVESKNVDQRSKPDLSSLKGVQVAIAITGFETSEQKVTDEQSSAEIKPKFVAVIDTHAWHFQAVRFAQDKLGAFVERTYGSKPTLDEPERNGGRDMTWTAADGRKAYAFVTGGVVYFSNDHAAIDRCLAVKKGEADSIAKVGKIQPTPTDAIASGYVSADGVANLADVVGLKFAAAASDDPKTRAAVATVVPQILRGMITEVLWTARPSEKAVQDVYQVTMPEKVVSTLKDTRPSDLEQRVGSTLVSMLSDSGIDPVNSRLIAASVVALIKPSESTQTQFTATGMQRTTISETGLLGSLLTSLVPGPIS